MNLLKKLKAVALVLLFIFSIYTNSNDREILLLCPCLRRHSYDNLWPVACRLLCSLHGPRAWRDTDRYLLVISRASNGGANQIPRPVMEGGLLYIAAVFSYSNQLASRSKDESTKSETVINYYYSSGSVAQRVVFFESNTP